MPTRLLVVSFAFILNISAFGQNFLVLEKMGTKKRFEYHIGDKMEIKLDDDDYFTKIQLVGLGDSSLFTENLEIDFSTIAAVHTNKNTAFVKYAGSVLMVAGVILFSIDIINQTAVQGGPYSFSSGVAIASASMVGVGAIFRFTSNDKIKLKKWWRLRVVNI